MTYKEEFARAKREYNKEKQSEDGLCPDCNGLLDQFLMCRGECLIEAGDRAYDEARDRQALEGIGG